MLLRGTSSLRLGCCHCAHCDYNGETTTANNLVLKAEEQNDVSEFEW